MEELWETLGLPSKYKLEEQMTASYPPFDTIIGELDEERLASLSPEQAAQMRQAWQNYKDDVERLRAVYEPHRAELESEHWGDHVIFHLISGRFLVGRDHSDIWKRFRAEISESHSFGFKIGGLRATRET